MTSFRQNLLLKQVFLNRCKSAGVICAVVAGAHATSRDATFTIKQALEGGEHVTPGGRFKYSDWAKFCKGGINSEWMTTPRNMGEQWREFNGVGERTRLHGYNTFLEEVEDHMIPNKWGKHGRFGDSEAIEAGVREWIDKRYAPSPQEIAAKRAKMRETLANMSKRAKKQQVIANMLLGDFIGEPYTPTHQDMTAKRLMLEGKRKDLEEDEEFQGRAPSRQTGNKGASERVPARSADSRATSEDATFTIKQALEGGEHVTPGGRFKYSGWAKYCKGGINSEWMTTPRKMSETWKMLEGIGRWKGSHSINAFFEEVQSHMIPNEWGEQGRFGDVEAIVGGVQLWLERHFTPNQQMVDECCKRDAENEIETAQLNPGMYRGDSKKKITKLIREVLEGKGKYRGRAPSKQLLDELSMQVAEEIYRMRREGASKRVPAKSATLLEDTTVSEYGHLKSLRRVGKVHRPRRKQS